MRILPFALIALVECVRGNHARRAVHSSATSDAASREHRRLSKARKSHDGSHSMEMQRRGSKSRGSKMGKAKGAKGVATTQGTPMESISLENKRPEGITRGPGSTMFVSEMLFGGIRKVNVVTGEIKQVVPSYGFKERGAYGVLEYNGALFVAGGGVPDSTPTNFYIYDAVSGEELANCPAPGDAFLLNDVAIVGNHAFVTDSKFNKLMVVNIPKALKGICQVSTVKTPEEYFLADDALTTFPRANGIIAYKNGLIIARTNPGGLYYMDLADEDLPIYEIASPEDAPRNDGLAIADDILYSTQNTLNSISVWSLKNLKRSIRMMQGDPIRRVGTIQVPTVDFPATVEIYDEHFLCTVDARLLNLPVTEKEGDSDFDETFNMVCVGDRKDVDDA